MRNFKSLDLYRKASTDHSQQTFKGGIITLLAAIFIITLFLSECKSYLEHTIIKETLVDQDKGSSLLQVNIDIFLPYSPCLPISLDQQDSVNKHILDTSEFLRKIRISENGEEIPGELERNIENLKKVIIDKEGCRLLGHIFVTRVPGNFHISYHVSHNIVTMLPREFLQKIKFSHVINHLSFGDQNNEKIIEEEFGAEDFWLYDGKKVEDTLPVMKHEYFMKIIPVQFIHQGSGEAINSYQYSLNLNSQSFHASFGAIYFRYDFEDLTMRYTKESKSFTGFIVSLCAIIGGAFTVLGLVNKVVNS